MNKNTKTTTKKTAPPVRKKSTSSAPVRKAPAEATGDFVERSMAEASEWCGQHGVPVVLTPTDACRLRAQAAKIDEAIAQAGGASNVPTGVLAYSSALEILAALIMAHGLQRVVYLLASGAGR